MGPGLNELEFEVAVLRMQEIISEFRMVQPKIRHERRPLGARLRGTFSAIVAAF